MDQKAETIERKESDRFLPEAMTPFQECEGSEVDTSLIGLDHPSKYYIVAMQQTFA